MSVLAVIFFGLCVTSVWSECGTCDKTSLCPQEPTASDCQFGLVKDACNCCSQCAKGIGETCGTRHNAGVCAPGLICKLVSPRQPSKCDEDPDAPDQVVVQEVPADAIQGENIQDTHTPEEEGPVGNLTPSRNSNADASVTQGSVSQGSRNDQVQRPLRGEHSQVNPEHNERTQENPAEAEADHSKRDAEPDVTSQDTPAENEQEQQDSRSSAQGTPQRGNQGLRGNNAQNTRTRGSVPAERVSTTQAPQADVTESHSSGNTPGQRVPATQDHSSGNAPGQRVPATQASAHEETEHQESGIQRHDVEVSELGQDEHDQIVASEDATTTSHDREEPLENQKAAEGQLNQNHDDPNHTHSEGEEQEPVVPSGQNRRAEVDATRNNNSGGSDQTRGQTSRQTARSRQTRQNHNEPTPRHNHEGSIQNLNEEDINENYNHDTPKFDNRTS